MQYVNEEGGAIHPGRKMIHIWDVFAFLAIFSVYTVDILKVNSKVDGIIILGFLGISILYAFVEKISVNNTFIMWSMLIILASLCSLYYTKELSSGISVCYMIVKSILTGICFSLYIANELRIKKIFFYFKLAGLFISIYSIIFFRNELYTSRFGEVQVGNANTLGFFLIVPILMIALDIFEHRNQMINIVISIPILYVMLATGSRKSILFLFFLLLLFIGFSNGIKNKIKSILFSLLIISILLFCIFKIPQIYHIIGVRMNGLLGMFHFGNFTEDKSTEIRQDLIQKGLALFFKQPVWGYGLNSSTFYFGVYTHNNYVETLIDGGGILFLLYYSIYFFILNNLIKYRTIGLANKLLVIALVCFSLFYDVASVSNYNIITYILFAMLMTVSSNRWKEEKAYEY